MLGLHTHLVGGDLREHSENALAYFSDPSHDLRAAAIVKLGPGSGPVDHGSTRDAIPAGRHPSSAFTGHRLLRRFRFLYRRKARTQRAGRPNIMAIEIGPSIAARRRRTAFPTGRFLQCVERPREAD